MKNYSYKDHAYFVNYSLGLHYSEDHKPHEDDEDRNSDPHASQDGRNLQLAAQRAQPEVNKASSGAEVAAEPSASERSNNHECGKDQQKKIAQLGVEDASKGYD